MLLSLATEPATAAAAIASALLAIHEDLVELAGEPGIIRSTTGMNLGLLHPTKVEDLR